MMYSTYFSLSTSSVIESFRAYDIHGTMKRLLSTIQIGKLSGKCTRELNPGDSLGCSRKRVFSKVVPHDTGSKISLRQSPRHEASSLDVCPLPPHEQSDTTRRFSSSERPDPFARRPTVKCDPYGQGGKPLTLGEAKALLRTVEPEWEILRVETPSNDISTDDTSDEDDAATIPFAIARNFWHENYMSGAQFINHVAAVAQMNAQHFPHQLVFDRKLQPRTKSWGICTRVVCRTHVLQGLSHHDFYLATLMDIEIERPEVRGLVVR